jgi:hypothetical protein
MNMTKFLFMVSIMIFVTSCRQPFNNMAQVKGAFTEASGFKLVLQEMDTREIHAIDSVVLDNKGSFSFSPVIKEPGFWLLKAPTGKILVLMLNAGDMVELTGSARDFPDHVIVKGPEEIMQLNDFFLHTRLNERRVDSLELLLVEQQDSSGYYQLTQKLDTSFKQIWESQVKYEKEFIDEHPGSLASLVVLNYAFGMSPVLSPEEDFTYYQKLDSTLFMKFPENKHVKFHHQRVLELKRNASITR